MILLSLSIYFPFKLNIPGTGLFIPNIFGCAVAILAAYKARGFIPAYYFVLGLLAVFLIPNILLTSAIETTALEKLKSGLLLAFNVSLFFLLSRSAVLDCVKGHKASYFLLWLAILVCLYAFLESRVSIFRQLSDSFRDWAYPSNLIYVDDARDVVLAGGIRPKVFASEPAHVAFAVSALLLLFVALTPKFWCFCLSASLYAVVALIVGSPFPILFLPALYLVYLLGGGKRLSLRLVLWGIFAIFASAALLWFFNAGYLEERYKTVVEGTEGSTYARIGRQVEFAQEGLHRNVFLGLGLGSEEELGNLLPHIARADRRDNMSIQSPLFALAMFCGVIGICLFILLLWEAMQLHVTRKLMGMGVFLVLFFQGGNISSCLGWHIGGLLLAILNGPVMGSRSFFGAMPRLGFQEPVVRADSKQP